MTAKLVNCPEINSLRMPIARLPERYGISFPELFGRFSQLEIGPKEIDGSLCVDHLQLQELDDLDASLQAIADDLFLYRMESGYLHLSETPLHANRGQWGLDGSSEGCGPEFIARGPRKEIVGLAHSLLFGLDDDMKGI
ncbi:MAG: hypothetical protein AAFQ89_02755 [Cyanobacteria bacterium J06626_18]